MSFSSPLVRLLPRSPLGPSAPPRPPSPPSREVCSISQRSISPLSTSSPSFQQQTPRLDEGIEKLSPPGPHSAQGLKFNCPPSNSKKGKKEKEKKDKKEKEKKDKKEKNLGKNISFYKKKNDSSSGGVGVDSEENSSSGSSSLSLPLPSSHCSSSSSSLPSPSSRSPKTKLRPREIEALVNHVVSLYECSEKDELISSFLCSFEQFDIDKVFFFFFFFFFFFSFSFLFFSFLFFSFLFFSFSLCVKNIDLFFIVRPLSDLFFRLSPLHEKRNQRGSKAGGGCFCFL